MSLATKLWKCHAVIGHLGQKRTTPVGIGLVGQQIVHYVKNEFVYISNPAEALKGGTTGFGKNTHDQLAIKQVPSSGEVFN